jgi:hypothetical protein
MEGLDSVVELCGRNLAGDRRSSGSREKIKHQEALQEIDGALE